MKQKRTLSKEDVGKEVIISFTSDDLFSSRKFKNQKAVINSFSGGRIFGFTFDPKSVVARTGILHNGDANGEKIMEDRRCWNLLDSDITHLEFVNEFNDKDLIQEFINDFEL